MVSLLSGLVSDTIKRPIILNGKLLTDQGSTIYVSLQDNYKLRFTKRNRDRSETEIEDYQMKLKIDTEISSFNKIYEVFESSNSSLSKNFTRGIDNFTQAIVIKSGMFTHLLDVDNTAHFHDGSMQFIPEVRVLLNKFITDYTTGYFEIFSHLMNRRLMTNHMPFIIKGHLVAGLYQPLIVETKFIDSPLRCKRFSWLMDCLNYPSTVVEILETKFDNNRSLGLEVISMADLEEKFSTPCLRNLSRVDWMFMLLICVLKYISDSSCAEFVQAHSGLYNSIVQPKPERVPVSKFLLTLDKGIQNCYNKLVVVR